jgi:hypothetical protein
LIKISSKIVDAPPIDVDVGLLKIRLDELACSFELENPAFLQVYLNTGMGDLGLLSLRELVLQLGHETPIEHPEIPAVHFESQEEQRRVGEAFTYDSWD